MKVHRFSVLGLAGVILLAGNVFGNGLQWKAPENSKPVAPSVTHIPTVITTNDARPLPVVQAQYTEPFQQPFQPVPQIPTVVLPPEQSDQSYNPLPGATVRNVPPAPPAEAPMPIREVRDVPPALPIVPAQTATAVPCGDQVVFKSIREISHDIRPATTGELPQGCVIESQPFHGRHFSRTNFAWKASALATKGAYFEDTQLERYGHTKVGPVLQPVVSGAKFFGSVVILPYKMGVHPPNECVYTLGHYRAGSCAPYMVEPFPVSPRGALFQAGAVTGVLFAAP